MQKTKTAVILLIIATLIISVGFVLVLTRKQSITIGGETAELKNHWGKEKVASTKGTQPVTKETE